MKSLYAIFVFAFLWALPAVAATDRIVAVVNDSVITKQDLDRRFALNLRQLNAELNESQRRSLYIRTLRGLVDEELYQQFAGDAALDVEPFEIDRAIAQIEQNNQLPSGTFNQITSGLTNTARDQIKGNILWQKITDQNIRPRIIISNDEVDRLIENLMAASQVLEREVSHILVSPRSSGDEKEARGRIDDIYGQLISGQDFATLAKAFSEDSSGSQGGYLGWFSTGEMAPALEQVLEDMTPGDISQPILSPAGWHILKLNSLRKTKTVDTDPVQEVRLIKLEAVLPGVVEKDAPIQEKFAHFEETLSSLTDIQAALKEVRQISAFSGSGDSGWIPVNNIPSDLTETVANLEEGQFSKILHRDGKMTIVYVDARRQRIPDKLQDYRVRIRDRLTENRVELSSRRFLRDLRRKAFIDIRL